MSPNLTTLTEAVVQAYNTHFCNTADNEPVHDTLRIASRAHQYVLFMKDLGLSHRTPLRQFITSLEEHPETPGQQAMLQTLENLCNNLRPISGRIVFAADTRTAPDPKLHGYGRHEITEGRS